MILPRGSQRHSFARDLLAELVTLVVWAQAAALIVLVICFSFAAMTERAYRPEPGFRRAGSNSRTWEVQPGRLPRSWNVPVNDRTGRQRGPANPRELRYHAHPLAEMRYAEFNGTGDLSGKAGGCARGHSCRARHAGRINGDGRAGSIERGALVTHGCAATAGDGAEHSAAGRKRVAADCCGTTSLRYRHVWVLSALR